MKIAVFVDTDGNAAPFDSSGTVLVYENNHSDWQCTCQIPFCLNKGMNLANIRKSIYALAPKLLGCKAFVVKRKMGIFNAVFEEELHIRLFALQGSPVPFLNDIRFAINNEIIEKIKRIELERQTKDHFVPLSIGDPSKGCYRIDLVKIQEKDASLNSKEILLPFFQNTSFWELEIICLHVPKWFDEELHTLGLYVLSEEWRGLYCHAFIHPIGALT